MHAQTSLQVSLKLALTLSFTGLFVAAIFFIFAERYQEKQNRDKQENLTVQLIDQANHRISDRLDALPDQSREIEAKNILFNFTFGDQSQSYILDRSVKILAKSGGAVQNQNSFYPAIADYVRTKNTTQLSNSYIKLFIDQKLVLVQIRPYRKGVDWLLITAIPDANSNSYSWLLSNNEIIFLLAIIIWGVSSYLILDSINRLTKQLKLGENLPSADSQTDTGIAIAEIHQLAVRLQQTQIIYSKTEIEQQEAIVKLQLKLKLQQDRFSILIQNSQNGLIIVDQVGEILFANQAATQLLKLKSQDGIGEYFGIPIAQDYETTEIELWPTQFDPVYAQMRSKQIVWENKSAYLISLSDISDRKLLELAQQDIQTRLEQFLNNLPAIISIKDLDGRYEWVNQEFEKALQIECNQVISKTDFDFLPINIAKRHSNDDQVAMISKGAIHLEESIPLADGMHSFFTIKFALRDFANIPYAIGGIMIDISDRKRMEEEMRQNQLKLQESYTEQSGLFNAITDIVIIRDANGKCLKVAPTGGKNLFNNPETITDCTIFEELPKPAALELYRTIQQVFATNRSASCDYSLDINGKTVWFAANISPISNDRVIQVAREITDRKEAEIALEKALLIAETATKLKTLFLANMSHEIRTPMNGVLGMAQLLQLSELNSDQKDHVKTISESGDSLLRIIDDILDLSKIESGNLELELNPFSLEDTIQSVLILLTCQAKEKAVELNYTIASNTPRILFGDGTRLRQILLNLVSNAIKFSQNSQVQVIILSERLSPLKHRLQLMVEDYGIGIAPNQIQILFQPFIQANCSISRRFGGTGLGLAISKRLVELMEGNIWVESGGQLGGNPPANWEIRKLDQPGSVFYFDLIMAESTAMEVIPPVNQPITLDNQKQITILVAEDNPVNQKLILYMLQKLGYNPDLAKDGAEALELLSQQNYDLIFMDMQMPKIDGIEATRTIRKQNQFQPWIVAVTANALDSDRQNCLDAGMNDYISKPIKIENLSTAISICPLPVC